MTPQERAVIEKVEQWIYGLRANMNVTVDAQLVAAFEDYHKATAPPEPFEAYVGWYDDDPHPIVVHGVPGGASCIWKATVTPIERVR